MAHRGNRWALLALLLTPLTQAATGGADALFDLSLEELLALEIQVGSRTGDKRVGSFSLPVDLITADQLRATGYGELPKALNQLLPAFTQTFATIDDLSDHARPFTLNGLKADQVLVLINGRRVHHSAILYPDDSQVRGGTGVDLNLMPIEAIERIEVLRDDASAQYGSDAIAGVINIVLKQRAGSELVAVGGQRGSGDGELWSTSFNHGQGSHFASLELKHKNHSNTSGLDRRDYYFDGDPRNGDYRVTHRYGDAEHESLTLTVNGEQALADGSLYYSGRLLQRDSEATGFFRRPRDDRNVRDIYPDGYLPALTPQQQDLFTTLGYRFELDELKVDLANTLSGNRVEIGVADSLNASLGAASPRRFDAGTLLFWQDSLNLDISTEQQLTGRAPLQWAFGGEYRHEQYRIEAGEPDSWRDGLVPVLDGPNAGADTAAGAQLYPGFSDSNATDIGRNVVAIYGELGHALSEQLQLRLALRDEYYSDFGNTLNGKVMLHWQPLDEVNVRASLASGFRAPALHQIGYYRTSTGFQSRPDGSVEGIEIGHFPVDHEVARLLGAEDLEPEQSLRAGLGLTWQPQAGLELSVDYFELQIRDRILLSGLIEDGDAIPAEAAAYMAANGIGGARYFTNAVDTTTQGLALGLKYQTSLWAAPLLLTAGYHYNHSTIDAVHLPQAVSAMSEQVFDRGEQQRLLHYLPEDKAVLSALWQPGDWRLQLRANYFGEVLYVRVAEDPQQDQWFNDQITLDAEIAWQLQPQLTLAVGAHNLLDSYPDYRRDNPPFDGEGNIFQYRGTSPFDYTGAWYYLRTTLSF